MAQQRFQAANVARLATVTADGAAHVVPCCFAFVGDVIVTAIDGKPKSTQVLQRLKNIHANPQVSIVVDHYADDWTQLWWVRVDGVAETTPSGSDSAIDGRPTYNDAIDALVAKYDQYKTMRPTGAVITIRSTTWRSWSWT